jgi:pimeloyl-ACP methyl ester carboxylesterase
VRTPERTHDTIVLPKSGSGQAQARLGVPGQDGLMFLIGHPATTNPPSADPARTVLAAHGITASAMSWRTVADALPDAWTTVAPDLRGRGAARDLAGPTGLLRHAQDLCRAAEQLDPSGEGIVLAGHSMGAYVALLAVDARPDLFRRVVLVDGGVPLPLPAGTDPDEVLAATLGPALERLSRTYADVEEYVGFFAAHPALGPYWSDAVEAYVRYDAMETADGVRSRAVEEAVRTDGRDLLVRHEELDRALRGLQVPTHLLCAPRGMFDEAPGLLPAAAVSAYDAAVDGLTVETVPDVNHYTILFDPTAAARVAEVIATV